MVQLKERFKTSEHEPVAFDYTVTDGDHLAVLARDGEKLSQAGNTYLSFGFQIVEGPCKGRWVWDNFHLGHPDPDVARISFGRLTTLCQACGVDELDDTAELKGIPVIITVKNKGENVNITNFKPESGKKSKNVVDKSGLANKLGVKQPEPTSSEERAKIEAAAKDFEEDKLPF